MVRLNLSDFDASKARLRQIQAAELEVEQTQVAQVAPVGHGRRRGNREAIELEGFADLVRETPGPSDAEAAGPWAELSRREGDSVIRTRVVAVR